MTSSKYIQLTNSILLEYIYNTIDTQTGEYDKSLTKDLTSTGAYLLYDNYTENSVFYTNGSQWDNRWNDNNDLIIPVNSNSTTFVNVNSIDQRNKFYYNVDKYNFTNTNILNKVRNTYNTPFDKIRVHFAQGFDFNEFDGFVFQIGLKTNEQKSTSGYKNVILCSQFVNKKDDFGLNPNPFLIGEKMYATYYDIYIPCVFNLITQECTIENGISGRNQTLSYVLTNGYGFYDSPIINIDLFGAYKCDRIKPNDVKEKYLFSYVHGIQSTSISINDLYTDIIPSIKEVDDYFRLEGALQNSDMTFSDYINNLPGTYIIMHDIVVQELLKNDNISEGAEWVMTTHNIITQTGDFEEPVYFRPVLKYSNAIDCVIDYSLRLYCETTNTQIIKRATIKNPNFVKKYGKRMAKINLGVSPQQINVYNKIDPTDVPNITFTNSNYGEQLKQADILATKYITTFRDRLNIKAAISTVKIQNIQNINQ